MSNTVIEVNSISKSYLISSKYRPDSLREQITETFKSFFQRLYKKAHPKNKIFWALKHITFQVQKGEVLGIIGRNGAGKSTLLKILSRITEPSHGTIKMRGRISSLLEVGTGFNPELTGRENIYLNGAIIGMSKKEINQELNSIIEFSGVREFIDTPVKHYSSGMYVRLAFSVAAHLNADVLLLDEVLAVGDSEFQAKCLQKMSSLARSGKTVIFVSHNMQAITSLCTRVILIDHGKIIDTGTPHQIISKYLGGNVPHLSNSLVSRPDRDGKNHLTLTEIKVYGSQNHVYAYSSGVANFYLKIKNNTNISYRARISLSIRTTEQLPLISLDSKNDKYYVVIPAQKSIQIICMLPDLPLYPGEYQVNAAVYDANTGELEDWIINAINTKIIPQDGQQYQDDNIFPIVTPYSWSLL